MGLWISSTFTGIYRIFMVICISRCTASGAPKGQISINKSHNTLHIR